MAAQSLDVQAAGFRAAAQAAAKRRMPPRSNSTTRPRRSKQVSDAALARAEFVLARQEKHRAAMTDMLGRLKEDSAAFETTLAQQRTGMEPAIGALGGEAKRFEIVTGDAERHLELIMTNAASRAVATHRRLLAGSRAAEGNLRQPPTRVLTNLVATLRDAGTGAQTLIGESAAQAKQDARSLVGEAMAECEKLLRAAGEMSAEATQIRETLAKTIEDVERHLSRLPTVAQGEAQRIRQMVQTETDQMLDISARTISTIHARNAPVRAPQPLQAAARRPKRTESEGLKGLARKLTQRPKTAICAAMRGKPSRRSQKLGNENPAGGGGDQRTGQAASFGPAAPRRWARWKWRWPTWRWIWKPSAPRPRPATTNGSAIWPATARCSRASWRAPSTTTRSTASPRSIARMSGSTTRRIPISANSKRLLARAREGDGGGLLTSYDPFGGYRQDLSRIAYALGRL